VAAARLQRSNRLGTNSGEICRSSGQQVMGEPQVGSRGEARAVKRRQERTTVRFTRGDTNGVRRSLRARELWRGGAIYSRGVHGV
jgi:hypothetical protein